MLFERYEAAQRGRGFTTLLPRPLYGASHANSHGIDPACAAEHEPLEVVHESVVPTPVRDATRAETESAMVRLAND